MNVQYICKNIKKSSYNKEYIDIGILNIYKLLKIKKYIYIYNEKTIIKTKTIYIPI